VFYASAFPSRAPWKLLTPHNMYVKMFRPMQLIILSIFLHACMNMYLSFRVSLRLATMTTPAVAVPIINSITHTSTRTLVVYSGPTSLNETEGRNELYLKNFEYFLRHGVVCVPSHDTVFVLTDEVAAHYQPLLEKLPCSVKVLIRKPICYDMESMRLVFEQMNVTAYESFVFSNCGMSGPKLASGSTDPWTEVLTLQLTASVKMVGLSLNCVEGVHVQSFTFALDRRGVEIVRNSTPNAIYDCTKEGRRANLTERNKKGILNRKDRLYLIERYERGMSSHILNAGYGIRGILQNATVTKVNSTCTLVDPWKPAVIVDLFGGRIPNWNETLFWKTSRFLTNEISHEVNYTGTGNASKFGIV